jgi:multidrug resistance protein
MIKKVFPVLALCTFSIMLGTGIMMPILPLYANQFGATGIWIGVVFSGYAISRAVFMPIIGRYSDRRGRKLFISIGLFVSSLIALTYILANNIPQLIAVRLVHGAFSGMTVPLARAWIGDISPRGEEGKWMGYFSAAFTTGMATGPLLGGVITDYYSMESAFAVMGGVSFLAFVAATFLLHESGQQKEKDQAELSFRKMSSSSLFRGIFIYRMMFELSIGGFAVFFPLYCGVHLGLGATLIGVLLAVSRFLGAFFQILLGRIADRFNRRRLLTIGGLLNFVLLAMIPMARSFWHLLGLLIIRSIGNSIATPAQAALSIEEGRKFGMGSTMAALALATSLGMGIGPILSGILHDYLGGIQPVFYSLAGVGLLGIILFNWYSRRYRPHYLTTEG